MANNTFFYQECPTCGRLLEIRVTHLGKKVKCEHCRAQLVASDPAMIRDVERPICEDSLLDRVDRLLKTVSRVN